MSDLTANPLFGLTLTIGVYLLMERVLKRIPLPIVDPLILAIVFIIVFLKTTGISYEAYQAGGSLLTLLITPATVALALPLYRNIGQLKAYFFPVLLAASCGVMVNCLLSVAIGHFFSLKRELVVSLLPKSVTTAISVDLSQQMGGISAVTLAIVVSTGILGALVAVPIFNLFQIHSPVAKGIALGSTSHAIGTGRALEIGETEGILAGLCICINGILTVILIPLLYPMLDNLM